MNTPRPTRNVLQVYAALLRGHAGKNYALELSKEAKVSVGTIYAVMARLEGAGLVTSQIEEDTASLLGRPPRRYYMLTGRGQGVARQELEAAGQSLSIGGPAYA